MKKTGVKGGAVMHDEYSFTIWIKRSRNKKREYRTYIQHNGNPFLTMEEANKAWCYVRDELIDRKLGMFVEEFGLCGFCKRVCGDWKEVK